MSPLRPSITVLGLSYVAGIQNQSAQEEPDDCAIARASHWTNGRRLTEPAR
jgi:hypothetical protein